MYTLFKVFNNNIITILETSTSFNPLSIIHFTHRSHPSDTFFNLLIFYYKIGIPIVINHEFVKYQVIL